MNGRRPLDHALVHMQIIIKKLKELDAVVGQVMERS